ncbi:hypothetical protein JCM11251_005684 [Rhodosporidiobolus azoricus]
MRSALILSVLTPLALAATHEGGVHRRAAGSKRASGYTLTKSFQGESFFDGFDFDTHQSNGGLAQYVDSATAWAEDLVDVKNGKAHIRVSPKNSGGQIKSVKLTTKEQYSEGLYIWDVERMPQVCGAWPAIWSTGDDWPNRGEFDLIEYVSHQSMNSMSVHTGAGCWAGSTGYSGNPMMGDDPKALNCGAEETSSQGCGFRTAENNTAGIGANFERDGVYVLEWSSAGIKSWFFPRADIPSDITSQNPDPSSWGKPVMFIDAGSCEPSTYFGPQTWVLNTQICGTWPSGVVWSTDNAYAGDSGSCQADTGYATCEDYALAETQDFKHAYWRVGYFRVFNK